MRAYKRLNKADVIAHPYRANKDWRFPSSALSSSNIWIFRGVNQPSFNPSGLTTDNGEYQYSIYHSAKHLYYSNYLSSSVQDNGEFSQTPVDSTGSIYYNFPQCTFNEIRSFPTGVCPGGIYDGDWYVYATATSTGADPLRVSGSYDASNTFTFLISSSISLTGSLSNFSSSNMGVETSTLTPISGSSIDIENLLGIVENDIYDITLANNNTVMSWSLQDNELNLNYEIYLTGSLASSSLLNEDCDGVIRVLSLPRDIIGSGVLTERFMIRNTDGSFIFSNYTGNLYYTTASSVNGASLTEGSILGNWDNTHWNWDLYTGLYDVSDYVGNLIYNQGVGVFTSHSQVIADFFTGSYDILFQNNHVVWENVVKCTIRESEFNYTQNPTILNTTGNRTGSLMDFATGSEFRPYVTSIGLYNDSNELLAVAKLAQPVVLSSETDTNFIIQYDT